MVIDAETRRRIIELLNAGYRLSEIARNVQVSRQSVYNIIEEYETEVSDKCNFLIKQKERLEESIDDLRAEHSELMRENKRLIGQREGLKKELCGYRKRYDRLKRAESELSRYVQEGVPWLRIIALSFLKHKREIEKSLKNFELDEAINGEVKAKAQLIKNLREMFVKDCIEIFEGKPESQLLLEYTGLRGAKWIGLGESDMARKETEMRSKLANLEERAEKREAELRSKFEEMKKRQEEEEKEHRRRIDAIYEGFVQDSDPLIDIVVRLMVDRHFELIERYGMDYVLMKSQGILEARSEIREALITKMKEAVLEDFREVM